MGDWPVTALEAACWMFEVGGPVRQVNKIRESLGVVVRNSTAYGLRQPHLERTRLCQLSDADLDPVYVRQRSGLRDLVRQLAKPKLLNGEVRPRATFCRVKHQFLDGPQKNSGCSARHLTTAESV